MALSIGSGSVWKNVTNLKIGSGSVWKQAQSVWVGVGGVWKKAWDYLNADAIDLNVTDFDGLSGPTLAEAEYRSAGTVYTQIYGEAAQLAGTWLLVGAASDFEIYLSGSGDTPGGDSLNTWLPLSTTRTWSLGVTGGSKLFTGTVQIRRSSDQVVVDTASLILEVESTF